VWFDGSGSGSDGRGEEEEEEEEVLLILDTGIAASIQLSMRSLNPSSADPYTSLKPAIKFSRSIEGRP
jgi:hypothetical protein